MNQTRLRKKILVIEDDPVTVRLLSSRLEHNGYEVVVATDGMAGIEMVRLERPDLITLDIMLPEVNGYTVCSFLKTSKPYDAIPIIMVTTRNEAHDRIFDESVKPEGFFNKPVNTTELLAEIHHLLETS